VFVLVHSPLVGPRTWSQVAGELRRRGFEVVVPVLSSSGESAAPYWQQHVNSAVQGLDSVPADRALILVGHSGAGPLLPEIRRALPHPVVAYVFVDASIPQDGASYLDLIAAESPEMAQEFHDLLEAGGRYPTWSDDDLHTLIPDEVARRETLAELQPRSLAYFTEPLPVFAAWPDAPCFYLHWSPPYLVAAEQARQAGWVVRAVEAGHFHLLVEPDAVAGSLLELVRDIAID
jgi:hypothetical protein